MLALVCACNSSSVGAPLQWAVLPGQTQVPAATLQAFSWSNRSYVLHLHVKNPFDPIHIWRYFDTRGALCAARFKRGLMNVVATKQPNSDQWTIETRVFTRTHVHTGTLSLALGATSEKWVKDLFACNPVCQHLQRSGWTQVNVLSQSEGGILQADAAAYLQDSVGYVEMSYAFAPHLLDLCKNPTKELFAPIWLRRPF